MLVTEQPAWCGIARHVDIGPTIVVKIGRNRRHGIRARGGGYPGRAAHVGKCSITIVAKELSEPGRKTARTTIYWDPLPRAISTLTRPGQLIQRRRSEEHTSELQSRGHLVCR